MGSSTRICPTVAQRARPNWPLNSLIPRGFRRDARPGADRCPEMSSRPDGERSYSGRMDARTVGGRYAIDGRLGEGGMGQVYRARHLQLGKAFALKIISPTYALDSAARARFNEEAKLASEISHPNIVSVVDFGEDAEYGA